MGRSTVSGNPGTGRSSGDVTGDVDRARQREVRRLGDEAVVEYHDVEHVSRVTLDEVFPHEMRRVVACVAALDRRL